MKLLRLQDLKVSSILFYLFPLLTQSILSPEDQCRLFGLEVVGGGDEMDWEDDQDGQDDWMEEVQQGNIPFGITHSGGKLSDLAKEYQE